jgi:hypothetical protein
MQKRAMLSTVPIVGSLAVFAALAGGLEGRAAANGGGTKMYAADGKDVQIFTDPVNGTYAASGALGTVRGEPFSPAASQTKEIGCWVDAGFSGAGVTCQAITATGQVLRCSSAMTAPEDDVPVAWGNGYAQGISTLNGDSFLTFITDLVPNNPAKGTGQCIGIRIENNSKFYPRQP